MLSRHHLLAAALTAMASSRASAQSVSGVVTNLTSGERIQDVEVLLRAPGDRFAGETRTDAHGMFRLDVAQVGIYTLQVRAIGYQPAEAQLVLQSNRLIDVQVKLAPNPVRLDAVVIIGEAGGTPGRREFLSRRHLPWNHSFNQDQIDSMRVGTVGEVLQVGAPVAQMRCMVVYIDGEPQMSFSSIDFNARGYEGFPLDWVYGIEVYLRYEDLPLKYRDPFRNRGRCGGILIWSVFDTTPGPTVYTFGGGLALNLERTVVEFAFRSASKRTLAVTYQLRIGEFEPRDVFGSHARDLGYSGEKRALYGAAFIGLRNPLPLFTGTNVAYGRIGVGGSVYGGESGTMIDSVTFSDAGIQLAVGAEVAFGVRIPNRRVSPWLELRIGAEHVINAGFVVEMPMLLIGLDVGARVGN